MRSEKNREFNLKRGNSMKIARFSQWVVVCALALVLSPAYSQQAGDVYMWEFNEGSGSTVTDNNGEFVANLGVALDPSLLPASETASPSGKAGDRSFRPNGGLLVYDDVNPVLAVQQGPLTVEAWVKPDELLGWRDICRIGNSLKAGFADSTLVFTLLGIVDVQTTVQVPLDGKWHHVAYVWEAGVGVTFFLDGVQAAFVEATGAARNYQNQQLSLGSSYDGSSNFNGLLDRVRIHNALLTAADLDSAAATAKPALANTLVAYNFDESQLPYQNSTAVARPAVAIAAERSTNSRPMFTSDSPKGVANDYSLYFDGTDRVIFTDDMDIMQFEDENFTFEAWLKFKSSDQVSSRAVLFAYGIGGQNGYSFSFRPSGTKADSLASSPSGQAGDRSIKPNSGLTVDDAVNPVLPPKEGPVTVEAWINPTALTDYTDILRIGNSLKAGFSGDSPVFTLLGIVDITAGDVHVPVDGAWHHLAYVWTPGVGVDFFLDGQLAQTVADGNAAGRDYENTLLSIGSAHDGGSSFNGLIDRLRIHNSALKANELDSSAASPKAPLANTAVAYNFNESGAPFMNSTAADRPAGNRGALLTVTTFGILDAHSSKAEIPDDNKWHHIAAAHEMGKEFRYFVDGMLKETRPYTGGVRFADVWDFIIGSESNGGLAYVGYLDRVKITRGALNEGQLDYFVPAAVADWSLF